MGRRDYCVEPYYLRRPNASISQILCLARANSYCWYGASVLSYRYFSISSLPSQPSFIPVLVLSNSLTPASTFPGVSSTPLYPLLPHRPPFPFLVFNPFILMHQTFILLTPSCDSFANSPCIQLMKSLGSLFMYVRWRMY